MRHLTHWLRLMIFIFVCCGLSYAEDGVLVLHVVDTQGKAISGVILTVGGDSSTSSPTNRAGRTRIKLAPQSKPGSEVALVIVRANWDLVFISPWNGRIIIPPFQDKPENVVEIVLAQRGDRVLLESGQALIALVS